MRLFFCSVQFRHDEWTLHYAYGYSAENFTDALEQAIDHFNRTQRGQLLSVNMTDGVEVLFMRRDNAGNEIIDIVPVGSRAVPELGPYTAIVQENIEENDGATTSDPGANSNTDIRSDGGVSTH